MDLQTRKLEFVQAFLKLQSEEMIAQFEKLLKNVKQTENAIEPFTKEILDQRIYQAEKDFENKRFKSTEELLSKY